MPGVGENCIQRNLAITQTTIYNLQSGAFTNRIFSKYDLELLLSEKSSTLEKANAFHRIAARGFDGYDLLFSVLPYCKETVALKILLDGCVTTKSPISQDIHYFPYKHNTKDIKFKSILIPDIDLKSKLQGYTVPEYNQWSQDLFCQNGSETSLGCFCSSCLKGVLASEKDNETNKSSYSNLLQNVKDGEDSTKKLITLQTTKEAIPLHDPLSNPGLISSDTRQYRPVKDEEEKLVASNYESYIHCNTSLKFDDLVLGNSECKLCDVEKIVNESKSFTMLHKTWEALARYLGLADHYITQLSKDFMLGVKIPTLEELFHGILMHWKALKGNQAKLTELCEAFIKVDIKHIADELSARFDCADKVECVFEWNGRRVNLEKLVDENAQIKIYPLIGSTSKENFDPEYSNIVSLLHEKLIPPDIPKYYVSRILSQRTELDQKIWSSELVENGDDFLLLKGIKKPDLAKLTKHKMIVDSKNWYKWNTLRAGLILLSEDKHYDKICNKWKTKNFHVVQHKCGRFFLNKSNQGMQQIKRFQTGNGKTYSEQQLVERIVSVSPCSVAIVDTAGIGKTLLLASLATEIRKRAPENKTIFINLFDFVQQLRCIGSDKHVLQRLAQFVHQVSKHVSLEYPSFDLITKSVLLELMKGETRQICIFLDGYDEVLGSMFAFVDSFLRDLQTLKNVKVIVAARPHLAHRLESIFHQVAYNIQPFDSSNQIDFLTKYWINHDTYQANQTVFLKQHARKCLKTLSEKLNDQEQNITGIPLHCKVYADKCAEDAQSAASGTMVLMPFLLFDMCKQLIEFKYSAILDQNCMEACHTQHLFQAISIFFPLWKDTFGPLLPGNDNIDENTIYSVGLIEMSQTGNYPSPNFVHRAFAEYLLAEFIVQNLGRHIQCADFIFIEIFGQQRGKIGCDFTRHDDLILYEPNYMTLAYFIEMHFQVYLEKNSIDELIPANIPNSRKFNLEDVCVTVTACCSNDLNNTFHYAIKILQQYNIDCKLRDKYFRRLPHVVVGGTSTENLALLEDVLQFTQLELGVDINYHVLEGYSVKLGNSHIPNYTPLHLAVYLGSYNMAVLLMQKYDESELKEIQYLIHVCVCESAANVKSVIEDKLLIIDMLVSIKSDWLKEKNLSCTPLLQSNVHLSLLKRLVEHGADINAYSSIHGTVLHMSGEESTFHELLKWTLSNDFELINVCSTQEISSLMHAIRKFTTLENETLKLFYEQNANFNAQDIHGNTVLFYALEHSASVNFIMKLLDYGADLNSKNNLKQNVIHKVIQGRLNSEDILKVLHRFKSKGIYGEFHEKDLDGNTPHDLVRRNETLNEDVLKFFENGSGLSPYISVIPLAVILIGFFALLKRNGKLSPNITIFIVPSFLKG